MLVSLKSAQHRSVAQLCAEMRYARVKLAKIRTARLRYVRQRCARKKSVKLTFPFANLQDKDVCGMRYVTLTSDANPFESGARSKIIQAGLFLCWLSSLERIQDSYEIPNTYSCFTDICMIENCKTNICKTRISKTENCQRPGGQTERSRRRHSTSW